MTASLWQQCLTRLQEELPSGEFGLWIRPLQAEFGDRSLTLYAANRFILDWVRDKYLLRINSLFTEICGADAPTLHFAVGRRPAAAAPRPRRPRAASS